MTSSGIPPFAWKD